MGRENSRGIKLKSPGEGRGVLLKEEANGTKPRSILTESEVW